MVFKGNPSTIEITFRDAVNGHFEKVEEALRVFYQQSTQ